MTLHGFKPLQMSKAYAMARIPQSDPFDCLATSIVLILSVELVHETKLASKRIVLSGIVLFGRLSYTLITPLSQPTVHTSGYY